MMSESLWIKIKEEANVVDIVVGVYYRTSDQEQEVTETYRQLEVASESQDLVLMGDFSTNSPGGFWRSFTITFRQLMEEPAKRDVLLDLVLTKKGLVAD